MKITRAKLIDSIHQRMDGELSKQMIDDAIILMFDFIADELAYAGTLSVDNFGTIHVYTINGHVGKNVVTGELQYVKPKKSVMFSPHVTFKNMLSEKKSRFKLNNS